MTKSERLASARHGVTFAVCLARCAGDPAFVAEYDRLRGTNLSFRGSVLDLRQSAEFEAFADFVWDAVFLRFGPISHAKAGRYAKAGR